MLNSTAKTKKNASSDIMIVFKIKHLRDFLIFFCKIRTCEGDVGRFTLHHTSLVSAMANRKCVCLFPFHELLINKMELTLIIDEAIGESYIFNSMLLCLLFLLIRF